LTRRKTEIRHGSTSKAHVFFKRNGNIVAKPAVIVVGADKGGVGKTTVSRTVLDYFSANKVTSAPSIPNPRAVR